MHPRVIAQRQADARQRAAAAIQVIAAALELPSIDLGDIREKDAASRMVKEAEALAGWLEILAARLTQPESEPAKTPKGAKNAKT